MSNHFSFPPLEVKVWGDLACFTRPDMKVERMSYRVMTPSAARGILESIFWKPEFRWVIREIKVLNPIRHISIRRNEIKRKIPADSAKSWMKNNERTDRYFADVDRTQRNTLGLKNVAYIISANLKLKDYASNEHPAKYRDQFRRRVKKGECYSRPYLGCREFVAYFASPDGTEKTINLSEDIGRMLFDIDFENEDKKVPHFFQGRIENGVLKVPLQKYEEVWGISL
ncbi:type I-C CRISPR-associated protein Cas5c [Fuchsiella alkaliacetigena]|uniref:type I-C CRISPR-associated protein Cas5c n=1 Tax=Fuchsiella alkaliacetigena TaxID=957042 RepID=UPI002009EF37|nr:type I-C CRISPR-associated protein Cas5c [Fuchsiella alkaliacetigena]MCK8823998.1 type I-C CRISPR-associated protein Cas5c [Fuchsiella alkaliacetigena]